MPSRPQNRCSECGYTWFPRGRNTSRRCPGCGVVFSSVVGSRTNPATTLLLGCGGCAALVVGAFCLLGLLVGSRDVPPPDKPGDRAADLLPAAPVPGSNPAPPIVGQAKLLPPSKRLPIAPAPRPIFPLASPPPYGWVSEWNQRGQVRVRARGAAVQTVPLINARGTRSRSPSPCLVLWVEVQNLSTMPRVFRPWAPAPIGECVLFDAKLNGMAPPSFPPGDTLDHPPLANILLSGDGTAVQALLFQLPTVNEDLTLSLAGDHMGEAGLYVFGVPATPWLPTP